MINISKKQHEKFRNDEYLAALGTWVGNMFWRVLVAVLTLIWSTRFIFGNYLLPANGPAGILQNITLNRLLQMPYNKQMELVNNQYESNTIIPLSTANMQPRNANVYEVTSPTQIYSLNQAPPHVHYAKSQTQFSKSPYFFNHKLCQERKHRMDWEGLLRPCKHHMTFSTRLHSSSRTETRFTYITNLEVRKTGDYSSFRIRTYDTLHRLKTFGGDTWRVFLKGPVYHEPFVYDFNNGEYEVLFFLLEQGTYNVEVVLEGTLCSSYVDPPKDWFKRGDFNGHFQSEWMYKKIKGFPYLIKERIWKSLRNFTIQVQPGDPEKIEVNLQKMDNWQAICHVTCNFLADGFGRWKDHAWHPYVKDMVRPFVGKTQKLRQRRGLLWIYGDCYAYHFYQSVENTTLCEKQFKKCNNTYNWVYPRWHPDSKKDKSIHLKHHFYIDLPWLVRYFKGVLNNPELKRVDGGMLLNLGLHFIRSTSFRHYQQLIEAYIKVIKSHPTDVIWRTTTSIYRAENIAHKRFQTNQRALLFNAYSMTAMCDAGIPVVDVFQMTAALPEKPQDGIHFNIELFEPMKKMIEEYYKYI